MVVASAFWAPLDLPVFNIQCGVEPFPTWCDSWNTISNTAMFSGVAVLFCKLPLISGSSMLSVEFNPSPLLGFLSVWSLEPDK